MQPPSTLSGRDDVGRDAVSPRGEELSLVMFPTMLLLMTTESSIVDDTAAPKKKMRSTNAAKAALHKYFSDSNWLRNKNMPNKHNGDVGIGQVLPGARCRFPTGHLAVLQVM